MRRIGRMRLLTATAGAVLAAAPLGSATAQTVEPQGPAAAQTAKFRMENAVSTSVTVTDNYNLERDGEEDAALIWGKAVETSLRGDGNRFDFALDAGLGLDNVFSDTHETKLRNSLTGFASAEVLEDLFFVEANARSGQYLLSDAGATTTEATGAGGRTNVYSFAVSPYLRHSFAGWADTELRYRHAEVYTTSRIGNTTTDQFHAELGTGARIDRFGLTALGDWYRTDSEYESGDLQRQSAELRGRYSLMREFALTGSVGYLETESPGLTRDLSGPTWTVGFIASPGPRTSFALNYGSKYDQPYWGGEADYAITPRLRLRASYDTSVETTQSRLAELGYELDPLTGKLIDRDTGLPVDLDRIDAGLGTTIYVAKRFDASLVGDYERNTIVLSVVNETRDYDRRGDEDVRILSAQVSRDLQPDLEGRVLLSWRSLDPRSGTDSDTLVSRVSLDYTINPDLTAGASLGRNQRFADDSDDEYTEHIAVVSLRLGL